MTEFNNNIEKLSETLIKIVSNIQEQVLEKTLEKVLERVSEKLTGKIVESKVEQTEEKIIKKVDENLEQTEEKYQENTVDYLVNQWDIPLKFNRYNIRHPIVVNTTQIHATGSGEAYVTVGPGESYFLANNKRGPTYVTLPSTSISIWTNEYIRDKEIVIKNLHGNPIFSSSNNIQQLNSKELSNCIMPAEKNKYVRLRTNGENWYVESIFEATIGDKIKYQNQQNKKNTKSNDDKKNDESKNKSYFNKKDVLSKPDMLCIKDEEKSNNKIVLEYTSYNDTPSYGYFQDMNEKSEDLLCFKTDVNFTKDAILHLIKKNNIV